MSKKASTAAGNLARSKWRLITARRGAGRYGGFDSRPGANNSSRTHAPKGKKK